MRPFFCWTLCQQKSTHFFRPKMAIFWLFLVIEVQKLLKIPWNILAQLIYILQHCFSPVPTFWVPKNGQKMPQKAPKTVLVPQDMGVSLAGIEQRTFDPKSEEWERACSCPSSFHFRELERERIRERERERISERGRERDREKGRESEREREANTLLVCVIWLCRSVAYYLWRFFSLMTKSWLFWAGLCHFWVPKILG